MKFFITVMISFHAIIQFGFSQSGNGNISGFVYDSVGMVPMANVNVQVIGTKSGTVTNRDGYFKIKTYQDHKILLFSYMGYKSQEYPCNSENSLPIRIILTPETKMIGEVTISNSKFRNLLDGDSLQVLDYEIWKDRVLVLARSVTDSLKQRIYLTSLGGYIYSYRNLHEMGKSIRFQDEPVPRKIYLFKDTYGEIQLLAKTRVWQIYIKDNKIYLLYPTKYEDCMRYLFPIKCRLNDKLFYQEANEHYNGTFFIIRDTDTVKRVKLIYDEFGNMRYLKQRSVVVPLIVYNQEVVLFNFFRNEIEFFNEEGRSIRKVPTMFHTKWFYDWRGKRAYDLDNINFTQQVIRDEKTNKVYSVWRTVLTGRYTIKELNMDSGEIIREIAVPEHPFIDKVLVHDNKIWFMFRDREEQKYKSLFTMSIE